MIDIADGDVSPPLQGLKEGTTELPCPSGREVDSSLAISPSMLDSSGVYLPGWDLSPGSLLSDQVDAHEWSHHAFPFATLELLDLLSYSYMENVLD